MSAYTVAFVVKIQFFVFEMFIMAELAGNDTGPQFSQRAWTLLRKGAPPRSIVFFVFDLLVLHTLPRTTRRPQDHAQSTPYDPTPRGPDKRRRRAPLGLKIATTNTKQLLTKNNLKPRRKASGKDWLKQNRKFSIERIRCFTWSKA